MLPGPASPILTEQGRRVRSLGPGLAGESADARSGCPANRSICGPWSFLYPSKYSLSVATAGSALLCLTDVLTWRLVGLLAFGVAEERGLGGAKRLDHLVGVAAA